jgi:ketosteroid isomerase-like protein
MNKIDWTRASTIAPDDLPTEITSYLDAHQAHDVERAVPFYAADAVVTDEDHDYRGPGEIGAWMAQAGSQYTYTTTLTGAYRIDALHYDVTHRLEGDFPGGVADLHFRFTLRDGRIARLRIEP